MIAAEQSILQPFNFNVVEGGHQQRRPKRARKPNPKYLADAGDATHQEPAKTSTVHRRKRSLVRLSAREEVDLTNWCDISQTKGIRFEAGRLVITGKRTYGTLGSPGSDDDEYSLADLPQARQAKVRKYQRKMSKSSKTSVCSDYTVQSSSFVNATPEDELPRAKKQRTSTYSHAPMLRLFAAVEELEGKDIWNSPCLFSSGEPYEVDPESCASIKQTTTKAVRSMRTATRKSTQQPKKEGACQRTVGCDKGFKHTGFCRSHKVNSRENRLRRIEAKKRAE